MVLVVRKFIFGAITMAGLLGLGMPACKQRTTSGHLLYAGSEESKRLARQVKTIFEKNCTACHGSGSAGEAGFDVVDNLNALVTRGYVVPGNPLASKLFNRVTSGSMPPAGVESRPNQGEISVIQKWIELGAPDDLQDRASRPILSNEKLYQLMLGDLLSVSKENRPFTRYVTFHPVANAVGNDGRSIFSDEEIKIHRKGFVKLINSVSYNYDIVIPADVAGSDGAIMRINLRDYAISTSVWDEVVKGDPYRVDFSFSARSQIIQQINTQSPEVRADWFAFVASVPPFYHQFLSLPLQLADLERQLQININDDIVNNRVHRIGFNRSGVSNFNRIIERHELPAKGGAFWISYDFGGTVNAGKNIFAQPLGPLGPFDSEQAFLHDGGEMIWNLPNGLQAYLLTNSAGRRLDVGPINIVSDPKRPDRQVINGLSCMQCHAEGIKQKDDEIRQVVLENRDNYGKDAGRILELYHDKEANDRVTDADQKRFAAALAKMEINPQDTEPTLAIQKHFENEVSGPLAAAEFGMPFAEMARRLRAIPDGELRGMKRDLAALLIRGGTVKRDIFALHFARASDALGFRSESASQDTPPIGRPQFFCYTDAFEKSSKKIIRTIRSSSQASRDEALRDAVVSCRQLIDGLSLYECRESQVQACEQK